MTSSPGASPQPQLLPDLSTHFNDPFLSDFTLQLVTPGPAAASTTSTPLTTSGSSGGSGGGVVLAQYHVHGIVLAGQSSYFKSLLQHWMGADGRLVQITISEEEFPAAAAMLQCAYSNSIPADAASEQVLATMILADRYQLRVCVEACKLRLLALDSKAISWPTAMAMLQLPPGLREGDAFASLTEKAHARVWEAFKNLDEAWTSKAARAQWLALPPDAVERLLAHPGLAAASENVVYVAAASWLAAKIRQHGSDAAQLAAVQAAAADLLGSLRFPHMSGNFLAAVAAHHGLLAAQPELPRWLLEAMQWAKASEQQRKELQACASHERFQQRVGPEPGAAADGSAFTSYIAAADLQQAISKYRASSGTEAYYLLTAGHHYNGFTWRLKLTVKPPDAGSPNDMNIHVGLCWGIELEGDGPLPLAEATMVQVDFDIATWDFVMHEEDPTSSEGPVVIKAGTCWGWDDFFGQEIYQDAALWSKFMTDKQQLLLSCHLYSCS